MIRMAAATARAPTALRAGQFAGDDLSMLGRFWEVPRSQGRVMGAGKIDVAFLLSGP